MVSGTHTCIFLLFRSQGKYYPIARNICHFHLGNLAKWNSDGRILLKLVDMTPSLDNGLSAFVFAQWEASIDIDMISRMPTIWQAFLASGRGFTILLQGFRLVVFILSQFITSTLRQRRLARHSVRY